MPKPTDIVAPDWFIPPEIEVDWIRPIESIGASSIRSISACVLSVTVAKSVKILPESAPAILGTVYHRVLELASQGKVTGEGEDSSLETWKREIQNQESKLKSSKWASRILPLSKSPKYGSVRANALTDVQGLIQVQSGRSEFSGIEGERLGLGSEVRVSSSHGNGVVGSIDLVRLTESGRVLIDFKTGGLFVEEEQEDPQLKEDYVDQMKTYAALYEKTFGVWPSKMILQSTIDGMREVEFSQTECSELLEGALGSLRSANEAISRAKQRNDVGALASPSPKSCRFCEIRPICANYWDARKKNDEEEDWPNDRRGVVQKKIAGRNGKYRLSINTAVGTVGVSMISSETNPAVEQIKVGDFVVFLDLKSRGEAEFEEGRRAVLLRYSSSRSSEGHGEAT